MRQFKDFILLLCFFYLFVLAVNTQNSAAIYSALVLIIGFTYKYFQLKIKTEQNEQLTRERLNKQRETYISSLNHDLRIPVITQLRALELLDKEHLGSMNPAQREMISQIEQSCKCIINLISLMINIYSIENHTHKLIYEKFNLSEVVTSCFNELINESSEKKITFEYKVKEKNLQINADKDEIRKVITNLLSNTLANSNIGGKIIVNIMSAPDKIILSVYSDTNLNSLHNPLINSGYTTIGQAIRLNFCKKIIEIHKGRILSTQKQNAFVFELPRFAY